MKRILSFALILISILTLVSCSREEGEAPFGMIKASSEVSEFYLYVPKDWAVTTENDSLMASARASESDPSNVTLVGFEDGSQEYPDVDAFWAYYKKEFETRIFDFEENATTFTLTLDGEATMIDGVAAKKYEYNGKVGGIEFYYQMVLAKVDSVFYIFTYTSTPVLYEKHKNDVKVMLDYIDFK